MKLQKLVSIALIFLFVINVYSQQEKFSDSLHAVIQKLNSDIKDFEKSVVFKSLLVDDLSKGDERDDVENEIVELKKTIISNKIEVYKTRSFLPAKDTMSIKSIPDNILYNKELAMLKTYVKQLKEKIDGNPNEKIAAILKNKEKELEKLESNNDRKILEAFALNDIANLEAEFPERDMVHVSPDIRIKLLKDRSVVLDKKAQYVLTEDSKSVFKNSKITYRATILNTNFTIPLVRYNRVKGDSNKDGNIQLFNSIGAGISYSGGRISDIRDSNGELINTEFNNTFGVSLGFLFSATGNDGENENVFAPMASVNILDFQLGFGVELGTRTEDQRRGFLTIAYAIPLYKLSIGNYRIIKKGSIINDVIEN